MTRTQNAECRAQKSEVTNGRAFGKCSAVGIAFRSCRSSRSSRPSRCNSAFTLIELMVAMGLMAILLTMIAQIFYQASNSFRSARASVEISQNARSVFNIMEQDLTAAEFVTYGPAATPAQFRISTEATGHPTAPAMQAITFTTLAPQPGARYAAPEAIQQLALVRYSLEWDGEAAEIEGVERPTYRLVKQVRFPKLNRSDPQLSEWNAANLGAELDPADPNKDAYAVPEPLGFKILRMTVRYYAWNDPPPAPPLPDLPEWMTADNTLTKPPALVEITLEMTDQRATKVFTFTQRFYLPASER